ncbi:MAG: SH3 domain-containing protein [Chloroflexi bacterium]|nr:SH3 domain-containing protein [Chloroflexota bacterium]
MDEDETPTPPGPDAGASDGPPLLRELSEPTRTPVPVPLAAEPAPPAAPEQEINILPPEWEALLRNRAILSGIASIVVLLLIVVVLFVFSRGKEEPVLRAVAAVPTANAETTAFPTSRLAGEAITTTTVRNGPNSSFLPLGTIPRGGRVPVVGRNEDESWLQVIFPADSLLRGWVDAAFLEVIGDISQLDVAGPGPVPSLIAPISTFRTPTPTQPPPVATEPPEPTPELVPTPTPPATPTPPEALPPTPPPTEPDDQATPGQAPDPLATTDTSGEEQAPFAATRSLFRPATLGPIIGRQSMPPSAAGRGRENAQAT